MYQSREDCNKSSPGAVDAPSANSPVSFLDEKIEPLAAVTSVPSIKPEATTWRTSWKRPAPLSGLFGLFLGLAGLHASLAILYVSNGAAVETWRYQPATYLAVTTAIANQAIRYAAFQGAVISWWRRALRGTTLSSLHYDWAIAVAPWKCLFSRRTLTWMLLPCLASILVAIDGPLLQRASTVISAPIHDTPVDLQVSISPQVPRGFGGFYEHSNMPYTLEVDSGTSSQYFLTYGNNMADVQNGWALSTPIAGFIEGCEAPKKCTAKIMAPALGTTRCTESIYESNYLGQPRGKFLNSSFIDPPIDNVAFYTEVGLLVREQELINLTVVHNDVSTTNCSGTIYAKTCLLHSAIGLYDVTIYNDVVTLDSPSSPEILTVSNNTLVTNGTHWPISPQDGYTRSTLAGVVGNGQSRYSALVYNVLPHVIPGRKIQDVQTYFDWNMWFALKSQVPGDPNGVYGNCVSYSDPSDAVHGGLNELLFRVGVAAANSQNFANIEKTLDPGITLTQNVTGSQIGSHNVYHTNFWYFLGAAVLELFCMGITLPLYWAYWRFGRSISFSPLEIAKAFGAPLFADVNSNSPAKHIAERMGDTPIRYGVIESRDYGDVDPPHVGFGYPHVFHEVRNGTRLEA